MDLIGVGRIRRTVCTAADPAPFCSTLMAQNQALFAWEFNRVVINEDLLDVAANALF
jgi:hypothetical protein